MSFHTLRALAPFLIITLLPQAYGQQPSAVSKLDALMYHIDRMYVDSVNDDQLVDKAIVSIL